MSTRNEKTLLQLTLIRLAVSHLGYEGGIIKSTGEGDTPPPSTPLLYVELPSGAYVAPVPRDALVTTGGIDAWPTIEKDASEVFTDGEARMNTLERFASRLAKGAKDPEAAFSLAARHVERAARQASAYATFFVYLCKPNVPDEQLQRMSEADGDDDTPQVRVEPQVHDYTNMPAGTLVQHLQGYAAMMQDKMQEQMQNDIVGEA